MTFWDFLAKCIDFIDTWAQRYFNDLGGAFFFNMNLMILIGGLSAIFIVTGKLYLNLFFEVVEFFLSAL